MHLIISEIDKLSTENQNSQYLGLIKDRELHGYKLPKNVIIVLTIKDKTALKNISKEIYHLSVVAI